MADKKLGFKDFLTVDYAPGMPDLIKKNAKKRKMDTTGGSNAEYSSTISPEENNQIETIDEVLNLAQRRAVGRRMRINAPKIKLGRKRAMMRQADPARLKRRAEKAARTMLFKKLSKGKSKADTTPQQRMEIEKRLSKLTSRIKRLAIKLLPVVRQKEKDRRSHKQDDDDKK